MLLNTVPLPFLTISPSSHAPLLPSHLSSIPIFIHCQEGQPPKSHFNSARHRQRLVDPAASKVSVSCRPASGEQGHVCGRPGGSGHVGFYLWWRMWRPLRRQSLLCSFKSIRTSGGLVHVYQPAPKTNKTLLEIAFAGFCSVRTPTTASFKQHCEETGLRARTGCSAECYL